MKIKSVNPFDLSINAEFEEFDRAKVAEYIAKSAKAFISWKSTSFLSRKTLFIKCAEKLLQEKASLANIIAIEMGKPIKEGIAEIEKCAMVCKYYAENATLFLHNEHVQTDSYKSFVTFEPLGCIFAIMPWNFPFWQVFRFAAPTLMAGNVGLLKHASNVPLCSLAIERIFIESGFPEGVFQSVLISSSQVPEIISNKVIKAVSLTGSEQAGAEVAALAGKYIKKSVLELGGSDPFIVLQDADVAKAASMAVKSRMVNNGQSCIAAKRFIVEAGVYDEFIAAFQHNMQLLKQGNPLDPATDLGPMARADLLEDLLKKINQSVTKGARLVEGGKKGQANAAFMEKTILTEVSKGMAAYSEELFGPVGIIFKVKDQKAAIELANDTDFGLGASIWTSDLENAEIMAKEINSGGVFINTIVASDPRLPFGGINISGFGRELSAYGIKEFVNIKTVKIAAV